MFTEDGFHKVSLDAVARRADVARGTVYHQFGTKVGLLEAVVRDFEQRAGLERLVQLIEQAPTDRLLRDTITAGCRYWATDPTLVRKVTAVAVTDADAAQLLAGHDAGRLQLLTRVVERLATDQPQQTARTRQAAVDALWLLTSFTAYDELTNGRGLSTRAAATILTDLAEKHVAGHNAA
jgi:AcrR family transcriptional regulator